MLQVFFLDYQPGRRLACLDEKCGDLVGLLDGRLPANLD
jgi:hypothetical protein